LNQLTFYLRSIAKDFAPYAAVFQLLFFVLSVLNLAILTVFRTVFLLPAVFLFILSFMFFVITKSYTAKNAKLFQLIFFLMTIDFTISYLICCFLIQAGLYHNLVLIFLLIVLTGFIVVLLLGTETRHSLMSWMNHSLLSEKGKSEAGSGDIVIGTDKDTGKKVIVPYKDRFTHFLILGGTGTGKTSQALAPMAYQDIQNPDLGVIILDPKGDFAELMYAAARNIGREKAIYFNPVNPACPYFNPLIGPEDTIIENIVAAFNSMDNTSSTYFRGNNETLLRNSLKAVKRIYGDKATLNDVVNVMNNVNGKGYEMINRLSTRPFSDRFITDDNEKICNFFLNDYYPGMKGMKGASKMYSDSSAIRTQISRLISNRLVNRILNPPKNAELKPEQYIDFDRVLREKEVLCMTSAQGELQDLSAFLGYFMILSLQSAVFKRPGSEDTRSGVMLYIDEFQEYSNPGFSRMLTQGRSFRVASILATQNRALIAAGKGDAGKTFLDNVSSNARNVIIFPGGSYEDCSYYSRQFGRHTVTETRSTTSNRKYLSAFSWTDARESTALSEKDVPIYSETDLMYHTFGEVTVRVVQNNTLQHPQVALVSWLPKEVIEAANEQKLLIAEEQKIPIAVNRMSSEVKRPGRPPNKTLDELEFRIGNEERTDEFAVFPASKEEENIQKYDFRTDTGVIPDFGGEIELEED